MSQRFRAQDGFGEVSGRRGRVAAYAALAAAAVLVSTIHPTAQEAAKPSAAASGTLGAPPPGKANWLTDGGDPQRTSWQRHETLLSPTSVKSMRLMWKLQLDNQARQLHNLFPPMIVSDVQTARGLYRQEQVADAVARFDTVTKAVVGVGGWNPPSSTLHDALTPAERDLMRSSGVHADLSGVLLDDQGGAVETPLSGRIIAITAPQLRRIPEVIGIAYGLDKVSAAHAAIRGGYLHGLVTHTDFAQELLRESR